MYPFECIISIALATCLIVGCDAKPPSHVDVTMASSEIIRTLSEIAANDADDALLKEVTFGLMPERPKRTIVIGIKSGTDVEKLATVLNKHISRITHHEVIVSVVSSGHEVRQLRVNYDEAENGTGPSK